jgi:hypothetical protein
MRIFVAALALALFCSDAAAAPPKALTGVWSGSIKQDGETTPLTISIGNYTFQSGDGAHPSYAPATVSERDGVVIINSIGSRIEGKISRDGRSFTGKLLMNDGVEYSTELRTLMRTLGEKPPELPVVSLTKTSSDQPKLPPFLTKVSGHWEGALDMGADKVRLALDVSEEIRLTSPDPAMKFQSGFVFLNEDEYFFVFGDNPIFAGKLSQDGTVLAGQMGAGISMFPMEFTRAKAAPSP